MHRSGEIVWCCLPRIDSDPVLSTFLDEKDGGLFPISSADGEAGTRRYLPHANIPETRFETKGGSFRIVDFAPGCCSSDVIFVQHS